MRPFGLFLLLAMTGEIRTDCTELEKLCLADSACTESYKTLENCSINAFTQHKIGPDCGKAALALQFNPLLHCKCYRHMKQEQHCLKIYWTIHPLITQGYFDLENSPYEEIRSDNDTHLAAAVSDSDLAGDGANLCVNVADICNADKKCSKHRTNYVTNCQRVGAGDSCNRNKCHRYLRRFFKKVPQVFTQKILFCPCQDSSCAERRRKTIFPDCSFEEKSKPNCLQLVDTCRLDHVCRARLADFQAYCQFLTTPQTISSCQQNGSCLRSYMRMIGTVMTPNYTGNASMEVSLWCSCKSSGNRQAECEKIFNMFTNNVCLKRAIESQMRINKMLLTDLTSSHIFPQNVPGVSISAILDKENPKEMEHYFEYREASTLNSKMSSSNTGSSLVYCLVLLSMESLKIILA
uniref:GDNF family receptor alpha-3 n=1 Tax=Geotrypetes seraphini TaxID=260995 RepID=A0A6P8Q8X2_GEOSA|nr:GDNF family receptor alpha-3 [Geotrypetes seraphini]